MYLVFGLTGILTYVFGWFIYTDQIDKILIRKKKLKEKNKQYNHLLSLDKKLN